MRASNCTVEELVGAYLERLEGEIFHFGSFNSFACQLLEGEKSANFPYYDPRCEKCCISTEAKYRNIMINGEIPFCGLQLDKYPYKDLKLYGQDAIDALAELRKLADPSIEPLPRHEVDWFGDYIEHRKNKPLEFT